MVSVTLSVPPEIRALMNKFPEVNWSGFIRTSIEEKVKQLSWKEEMLKKLKGEEAFTQWAVKAQRESRRDRLKKLKRKGLL
ncbi:hypothetical protein CMO88_02315 [Candidatus Woesearchaeota archaeon]|nr:hypothetical protein [Candidatus Woesearchaeota archaeon]|tara:strand:- start:305 stop:547 length:243 start_codon:yes stop_codon:yes gene_type:complete